MRTNTATEKMPDKVTIKNVLLDSDRVDKDSHDRYFIQCSIDAKIIGRLIESISKHNGAIVFSDKAVVEGTGALAPIYNLSKCCFRCQIGPNFPIYVDKDFRPEPFPGQTSDTLSNDYIVKGIAEAKQFLGLEITSQLICDITFHGIKLDKIAFTEDQETDVFELTFGSIEGQAISMAKLTGIGLSTGCPNWG